MSMPLVKLRPVEIFFFPFLFGSIVGIFQGIMQKIGNLPGQGWGWSIQIICVCFRHWTAIIKGEFYESQTIPLGDPFCIENITFRRFIFIA